MEKLFTLLLIAVFFFSSCQKIQKTEILWDEWGVPHIYAKNNDELFFSYGNSSQEGSPHFGDQLELFSNKEMRQALFYCEDVEQSVTRIEILENGIFVSE